MIQSENFATFRIGKFRFMFQYDLKHVEFLPRFGMRYLREKEHYFYFGILFFSLTIFDYTRDIHL